LDFNILREYIVNDFVIQQTVGDNVFLYDRPENCECDTYITYSPKELGSIGGGLYAYQIDIRVISKRKLSVLTVKDHLVKLLDDYSRATRMKDNDTYIRKIKLINGGGIAEADNGDYYAFLYFHVVV
jgi:hypothetical protein